MHWQVVILSSITFALGCWLWHGRHGDTVFQWLGGGVLMLCVVEWLGTYLLSEHEPNFHLFNTSWLFEQMILLKIAEVVVPSYRRWLIVLAILLLLVWAADGWFGGYMLRLVSVSITLGALVLSSVYLYLLWDLSDTAMESLRTLPRFWFFLSVVLFYGATAPLLSSFNYLREIGSMLSQPIVATLRIMCTLHYLLLGVACALVRPRVPDPAAHAK